MSISKYNPKKTYNTEDFIAFLYPGWVFYNFVMLFFTKLLTELQTVSELLDTESFEVSKLSRHQNIVHTNSFQLLSAETKFCWYPIGLKMLAKHKKPFALA